MQSSLSRLGASLRRIVDVADDMDTRLLSAPPKVRARDETLRCASVVILSGFFESFFKDCAVEYVDDVVKRRVPFGQLPKRTQERHFEGGGQLVGMKVRNNSRASWVSASYLDISLRLSSPSGASYSLVWEAFANTQGNPGPDVIDRFLHDFGVLKRNEKLDAIVGGGYATLKLALQSFIDVRNECAHTGSSGVVPGTGDLRAYCKLIEKLATAIVSVLEEHLSMPPFGININTASVPEIAKIPFLSGRVANEIALCRGASGPFADLNDLGRVKGIGPATLIKLRKHVHFV